MLQVRAGILRCLLVPIVLVIVTQSGCRKPPSPTSLEMTQTLDRKKAEETRNIMAEIARVLDEHSQKKSLPSETELVKEIERLISDPLMDRGFRRPGPMLDAWKTPIRYEHLDDGKTYRLVSAGSDGVFETTTTPPLGERYESRSTETLEEDLVLENGHFTRDLGAAVGLDETGQAIVQMNGAGGACETYAVDHDRYPAAASMSELSTILRPYIKKLHEVDPWGTPYAYRVAGDQVAYRFASAGPDRTFDESSLSPPGAPCAPGTDDLVWENGRLIAPKK